MTDNVPWWAKQPAPNAIKKSAYVPTYEILGPKFIELQANGMSYQQIADAENTSTKVVGNTIHRYRKAHPDVITMMSPHKNRGDGFTHHPKDDCVKPVDRVRRPRHPLEIPADQRTPEQARKRAIYEAWTDRLMAKYGVDSRTEAIRLNSLKLRENNNER